MSSRFLIEHLARGKFNFLRSDPAELRRVVPLEDRLPTPERIFLEDESATPLVGFPILKSRPLTALDAALGEFVQAEEELQFAGHTRSSVDQKAYAARWERYRTLLAQFLKNAVGSSFGARYPDVFWLYHSQFTATLLRGVPQRMTRRDLSVGRDFGDAIKYRIFHKWIDKVTDLTHDVVQELATEFGDDEEALFPSVLTLLRDNVLILTEDHISPDLGELKSYFSGYLSIDGRDFRQRLAALRDWHEQNLRRDAVLKSAVAHLLRADPGKEDLMTRPGFVSYLASHHTYSDSHFLTAEQVQLWERLLLRLKEFELLATLRKMIVPIEIEDGRLVSHDRSTNMTWVGGPPELRLSPVTRPIDFSSSWVVDPQVERFGLVYDISDFSATISMLGRAEKTAIDHAFRTTFSFQRKINKLADSLHLRLEKYLGDGAFFSSRHPRSMMVVAIHVQRLYEEAIRAGFPFDRGLRIALNYGEYRLLPLEAGPGERQARYEYFGHGLVELARLTTGKKTQEIDEFKMYLVSQGYPESTVTKFFEPMMRKSADLVKKDEEARRFFAYINQNGTLINEGIVATEPFLRRLGDIDALYFTKLEGRGYVILEIEEPSGDRLPIGVRKLGNGKFKGLEEMPVYELVDARNAAGASLDVEKLRKIPTTQLLPALEKVFAARYTSRSGKQTTKSRPVITK